MTPEQAIAFATKLPSGWLALAEQKLTAMDTPFSAGHISKVKQGHKQNDVIEAVLFDIAAEESARRAAVSERIASL